LRCAGYEWVGWKNESGARPVEIVFEFDRVRNFSAIHLHANNLFTKDVQVSTKFLLITLSHGKLMEP